MRESGQALTARFFSAEIADRYPQTAKHQMLSTKNPVNIYIYGLPELKLPFFSYLTIPTQTPPENPSF